MHKRTITKGTAVVGRLLVGDKGNDVIVLEGAGAPTDGTSGTAAGDAGKGSLYIDRTNGKLYQNTNTLASPTWGSIGDIAAAEIALAEGNVLVGNASGAGSALSAKTSGRMLVGDGTTIASVAVSGDATLAANGALSIAASAVATAKIANAAVTLAKLSTGAAPIKHVVAMGIFTTAGGDATESIVEAGVLSTDTAVVWVQKAGAVPKTVDTITPAAGSITVVLSGDPSTDHELGYVAIRAAA